MDMATLAAAYPRLFHLCHAGGAETILRHGLLSASSLLVRYDVPVAERQRLDTTRRAAALTLQHPTFGRAVGVDRETQRASAVAYKAPGS